MLAYLQNTYKWTGDDDYNDYDHDHDVYNNDDDDVVEELGSCLSGVCVDETDPHSYEAWDGPLIMWSYMAASAWKHSMLGYDSWRLSTVSKANTEQSLSNWSTFANIFASEMEQMWENAFLDGHIACSDHISVLANSGVGVVKVHCINMGHFCPLYPLQNTPNE